MSDPVPPPNRLPWPPILTVVAAAAAVALGAALPTPLWPAGPGLVALGGVLVLAALGLDLWTILTLRRHHANVLPHRVATALVTTGPFAWSRNPIYVGNVLLLIGATFLLANPWFLPAAALLAVALHRLAIRREEAHLARRFGAAWEAYRQRTARWFGPW